MKHLAPIRSLSELRSRSVRDSNYKIVASRLADYLRLTRGNESFEETMKLLEYEAILGGEDDIVLAANTFLDCSSS